SCQSEGRTRTDCSSSAAGSTLGAPPGELSKNASWSHTLVSSEAFLARAHHHNSPSTTPPRYQQNLKSRKSRVTNGFLATCRVDKGNGKISDGSFVCFCVHG